VSESLNSGNRTSAKGFPGLEETYFAFQEVLREKGVDLTAVAREWALQIRQTLKTDEAERDFDALCNQGCHPVSLAVSIFAGEFYPIVVSSFRAAFGISKQRVRYSRKLRQAADILRRTVFSETLREGLWLKFKGRHESLPEPPSAMIRDLEFYAKLFDFVELASRNAGIKSGHDLPRFIVTGYVHLATNRWHDREVSALFRGSDTEPYDETAHRVWRSRNFRRINQYYCILPELLLEVGKVSSARQNDRRIGPC
jgi:hypothetical protein